MTIQPLVLMTTASAKPQSPALPQTTPINDIIDDKSTQFDCKLIYGVLKNARITLQIIKGYWSGPTWSQFFIGSESKMAHMVERPAGTYALLLS